jgi:hypothetical protein
MSEENKNPFTIGTPFTIQFDDAAASETDEKQTETEDSKTEETAPAKEEKQEAAPVEASPEKEVEEKSGKVEIEDILDKPVAFDDGEPAEAETTEAKEAIKEALSSDDANFDYDYVSKKLIEAGFWEDFEGREETEITKEVFEQLSKQQDKWKKENLATTLFSSLDPAEKEFLAFKKQGGDLHTYYQSRTQVDRINNLDIDSEQGKLNSIYTYYKNFVGWDDAKIQKHLARISETPEDLEEEAMSSYEKIQQHTKQQHDQLVQRQQQVAEQRQQAVNDYKKTVRETLKTKNFNQNQIKSVVSGLTKLDENGFAEVDKAFLQFRNNPERAIELYRFLTDYQGYIEDVTRTRENETKKRVFMDIKKAKKTEDEKRDFSFKPTRDRKTKNPFIK